MLVSGRKIIEILQDYSIYSRESQPKPSYVSFREGISGLCIRPTKQVVAGRLRMIRDVPSLKLTVRT